MSFRIVDSNWSNELRAGLQADATTLRIVCPFIKVGALEKILDARRPRAIRVVTRFKLADCAEGVSDIAALRTLLKYGAKLRGIRNLHAKLYIFGTSRVIVTSANLTDAALSQNHELGFVSEDVSIVRKCRAYFDDLWARSGDDLSVEQLDEWDKTVKDYLVSGRQKDSSSKLGDYGSNVGINGSRILPPYVADAHQAFVKFLGEGDNRAPLHFSTIKQVKDAGCHWSLAYPASKRPRSVNDGALMFVARLTREPNDIRVFGRAIGLRHVLGRDDATQKDIIRRPWREHWPHYIRVHDAEFVDGTLENGVSLNELMNALGPESFASTQRNAQRGQGNTDPRHAYRQLPAVELSSQGLKWLSQKLEAAFTRHGRIPAATLARLDWPKIP